MKAEICCGSYEDALAAVAGGAKRIELNSALHLGGLTPSVAALRLIKQHCDVEVMCMVRPRAAGFCYNEAQFQMLEAEARELLEAGSDGIVFGCLHADGTIHEQQSRSLCALAQAYGKIAVFHRAIDCTPDMDAAVQLCIAMGIHRILTSGQQQKATQAIAKLQAVQKTYGHAIEILAGSGLNADNVADFVKATGITQVHSSCKDWHKDPTTQGAQVSFAYEEAHPSGYEVVSKEKVRAFLAAVEAISDAPY